MRRIRFASTNPIKLAEAGEIILGLEALTLDLPEIQSTDPAVVVRHKLASVAALGLEDPVIVEDTGLAIDSWDGLPGALVKWFVERWGAAQLAHISHIDGRGRGARPGRLDADLRSGRQRKDARRDGLRRTDVGDHAESPIDGGPRLARRKRAEFFPL